MPLNRILLEIPVFNAGSAIGAANFGADRLELCSAWTDGGLTPGPGLLSWLKSEIEIPVFVMIRPRGGDFVYSQAEIEVMNKEVSIFSTLRADGFVFGILNADGTVNKQACGKLVRSAGEKPCTFHRAFDVSSNLKRSLEDIIDCGFRRILTSGGKNSMEEGLPVIKHLLAEAKDEVIIMPGGGMSPEFIPPLRETGYLEEVHASCKKIVKKKNFSQNKEVKFSTRGLGSAEYLSVDRLKVQRFTEAL